MDNSDQHRDHRIFKYLLLFGLDTDSKGMAGERVDLALSHIIANRVSVKVLGCYPQEK